MSLVPGYNFLLDEETDWSTAVPPSRRLQAQQPPEETDPGVLANRHRPTLIFNFPLPENLQGPSPARQQRQHRNSAGTSNSMMLMEFENPDYNSSSRQRQQQQQRNTPPSNQRQQQQQLREARLSSIAREASNNTTSSSSPTQTQNNNNTNNLPSSLTEAEQNLLARAISDEQRRLEFYRRNRRAAEQQQQQQDNNVQTTPIRRNLPETAVADLVQSSPSPSTRNTPPTQQQRIINNFQAPPAGRSTVQSSNTFGRLFHDQQEDLIQQQPQRQQTRNQTTSVPSSISAIIQQQLEHQAPTTNNYSQSRVSLTMQRNGNTTTRNDQWQISDFSYENLSRITEGTVSNGLSQKQLSRYKPQSFSKEEYKKHRRKANVNDDADEDFVCSICLEELQEGKPVLTLSCSHCFDSTCLLKWLEKNNKCPTCRFEIERMRDT